MQRGFDLSLDGKKGSDLLELIRNKALPVAPAAVAALNALRGQADESLSFRIVHVREDLGVEKDGADITPPIAVAYEKAMAQGLKLCPPSAATLYLLQYGLPEKILHFVSAPLDVPGAEGGVLFFLEPEKGLNCYRDNPAIRRSTDSFLVFAV